MASSLIHAKYPGARGRGSTEVTVDEQVLVTFTLLLNEHTLLLTFRTDQYIHGMRHNLTVAILLSCS